MMGPPISDGDDHGLLDGRLDRAIRELRRKVEATMRGWDTSEGWTWKDWLEWANQRPHGVVQILSAPLNWDYWIQIEELQTAAEGTVFALSIEDDLFKTIGFGIDWDKDPDLAQYVQEQQHFRWVRGLVAPDLAAVHHEVFDWFASRGDTLGRLHWREMEELVAASFEAQGLKVQLGPGRADGGIDIRMARHEVFGDVMTGVQVKSGRTPVKLHYVQALAAANALEGNHESLFVTASRYAPVARNWAGRWERDRRHRFTLATADDVEMWCAAARDRIWLPDHGLQDPEPRGGGLLVGRVLTSSSIPFARNLFGLVVRQTTRAVLMRLLDRSMVSGDSQRGCEVPVIPTRADGEPARDLLAATKDSAEQYWWSTEGGLFTEWDGRPVSFDRMD
jgi:restriction system protein